MSKQLQHNVNFNFIRYANCWEDPELLLEAMTTLGPNKKILSVASAGDNSFSLLLLDPEMVVAVDINKTQLYLTELKKAAIAQLEYKEVLCFLGFLPCENRGNYY